MATRRVAVKGIEWAKLLERVPEAQKPKLAAFRVRSDSYLRRMNAYPENPPKIDWDFYRKTVPVAGLVESFQKQYESFKIPIPADTATPQIDAQEAEVKKEIVAFKSESDAKIKSHKEEIARMKSLIPVEEMTLEEYAEAYPEDAVRPLEKETFWPHQGDELDDPKDDKSGH